MRNVEVNIDISPEEWKRIKSAAQGMLRPAPEVVREWILSGLQAEERQTGKSI